MKILALVLTCGLLVGTVGGVVQITRANPIGGIIEFERVNPVCSATVDLGTPRAELPLPGTLRAVHALPGGSGEGFRQTAPQPNADGDFDYYWYGYVAPKGEPALRAAGALVVYTIYYAGGHEAYRVHGTYNDQDEGFYACDQAGNPTGIVTVLPVEWTGAYKAQQEGTYTLTVKLAGGGFSGEFPYAEITVTDTGGLPPYDGDCLSHGHDSEEPMAPALMSAPASVPPLADCACGIDESNQPWQHNLGCPLYAPSPCTCGGTHDPGNKNCMQWQPPLFMPASFNGGGGANDIASDKTMELCAPTSDNSGYLSSYAGTEIPAIWVDYVNTVWRNKGYNEFTWTEDTLIPHSAPGRSGWKWSGTPANQSINTTQTNPLRIPAAVGGIWTVYSGEQLRYALENFGPSSKTIYLGDNINLNGMEHAWDTIYLDTDPSRADLTLMSEPENPYGPFTIYNLGCTTAGKISSTSSTPYGECSFISHPKKLTMNDLSFTTAKIVTDLSRGASESNPNQRVTCSGIIGGEFGPGGNSGAQVTLTDVNVNGSLLFTAGRSAFFGTNSAPDTGTDFFNCTRVIMENNLLYGTDHISGFVTQGGGKFSAKNCATIDSLICSIGGHSAGFLPCSTAYAKIDDCFASIEMYCSKLVGGFLGTPRADVTNCYSTGKLEGYAEMGGFMFIDTRGDQNITNCYSTMLVGLRTRPAGLASDWQLQGGFAVVSRSMRNIGNQPCNITNAYAAGEVGNFDVSMTNPQSVGGFLATFNTACTAPNGSSLLDSPKTMVNCYYDKQTTAMREWAAGDTKFVSGVTGVLTTDTAKAGTGLTSPPGGAGDPGFKGFTNSNTGWVFESEHYPQLDVFANPNSSSSGWGSTALGDKVRAWSLASTATVMLDTWDEGYDWDVLGVRTGRKVSFDRLDESHKAGKLAYDTVREIVSDFEATDITANATDWSQMIPGGARAEIMDPSGNHLDESQNNITIAGSGGTVTHPGLDWYRVSESYNEQTGYRPLRLTAYMSVDAGKDQTIQTGKFYNHRDDCDFTMMNTIEDNRIVGAPPFGDNFKCWSTAVEQPYPDTTKYYQVISEPTLFPASKDAWINTEIWRAKRADNGIDFLDKNDIPIMGDDDSKLVPEYAVAVTGLNTGSNLTLDEQMWNGEFPVYTGISGTCKYIVTYYWLLEDGRYRTDSKVITVTTGRYDLDVNVFNLKDGSRNSTAIEPAAEPDNGANTDYAYTGADNHAESLDHPYTTNVSAAWKKASEGVRIKKIELIMTDANGQPAGTAEVSGADLIEGTEITIPIEYYYYETLENIPKGWSVDEAVTQYRLVSQKAKVEVTYTVEKDSDGGYYLRFNKMVNPPAGEAPAVSIPLIKDATGIAQTDIYINDICNNIIVNLYVDETTGLKINKYLTDEAEEDETFVFQVDYRGDGERADEIEKTMYAVITVPWGTPAQTAKTATFIEMEPGWYTVTELDANWRYALQEDKLEDDNAPAAIIAKHSVTLWAEGDLAAGEGAVFTWCNSRKDVPWANGKHGVTNEFGGKEGPGSDPDPAYTIVSPYESVNWASWEQYKAGLHVHTENSLDDPSASAQFDLQVEKHYELDYDILAITDHDILTKNWVDVEEHPLSLPRFKVIAAGSDRGGKGMLMIPYTEEQSRAHHMNTFFTDFTNSIPKVNSSASAAFHLDAALPALNAVQSMDGLSFLNHPGRYTGGRDGGEPGADASNNATNIQAYVDIFMNENYSTCVGMEIINRKDDESRSDRILWDNILQKTVPQGRYVWGFANDDTHSVSDTGYSFEMFLMPENNLDEFKKAMHAGSFYAVARVARREGVNADSLQGLTPVINSISVNKSAASITINASNYSEIKWISNGQVIATGETLNIPDYESKIGCYVRANIIGPEGIAFTQPFGVIRNNP